MRSWIAACLTLVGCRQIFGLAPPTMSDGGVVTDAFVAIDAPDAGACLTVSTECAGSEILRTCASTGATPIDTTCPWGCNDNVGEAGCQQLVPSGGVLTSVDLAPATQMLADVDLAAPTTINTDTGEITGVRTAGTGVISGIDYVVRADGGVFKMRTLTVSATVGTTGLRPLVLVAFDGASINATLDLRGGCIANTAGPGGGQGGMSSSTALGSGAGEGGGANISRGGGGGGHGGVGGTGGNGAAGAPPAGGVVFGTPEIATLRGGGGGGGGGDPAGGGVGGGGGGAVQIVANGPITVGSGGVINAGGCGGEVAMSNDSGGGGGAGGAILLEGTAVAINGVLAVNGGGGAAGDDSGTPGTDGLASRAVAAGGPTGQGLGGNGAAGGTRDGSPGTYTGNNSGGGGGAVGRIRINSRSGTATVSGVMSPAFSDSATTATQGAVTVQ